MNDRSRTFVFISTCPEPWGGSEELWWGAACALAAEGHRVAVFKTLVDASHPRIRQLVSLGCSVADLNRLEYPLPLRLGNQLLPVRLQFSRQAMTNALLRKRLQALRPDLIVVSQGDNFDGAGYADLCRQHDLPYALIAQKASEYDWPQDWVLSTMRRAYEGAVGTFFVSQHNWRLTELQIGSRLESARVVKNPYLTRPDEPLTWPNGGGNTLMLACVGRFYLIDKGQDILLKVLSKHTWRSRDVHVSFFGRGCHRESLGAIAEALGVHKVSVRPFTDDVLSVWAHHHALVLPSRKEGLPIVLVEAMMCGRPAIITNTGGGPEVVEDNETGFIAAAPTEEALDEAMERAWSRRDELEQIGRSAARRIRELVSHDPVGDFTNMLRALVDSSPSVTTRSNR